MIIGIDLGTTNSLVAVWRDGRPQLIPNGLGEVLTPSCVSIDSDGSILVGHAAKERLHTHADQTAAVFKRFMGSEHRATLHKKRFRAEELSALVLKALKADAEVFLGEKVNEAVITVPAYFSDAQRKATRTAGQLAGLNVERLVNEPTAAAMAYGIHQGETESRFLVFDLGGGTFDVSVLDYFEGVMEVRASAGDTFLGGEDFDAIIVDMFFENSGLPSKLKSDLQFLQQLKAHAERAKRMLSTKDETQINLHHGSKTYSVKLDEADFEKRCAGLLARLRDPVERALRDAKMRSSELDKIVLAGGATRMPIVRRLVARMFGRFPESEINPDEVVALGAAVQAGLKMRDVALKEVVMTDVAPYSLGIEVSAQLADGSFSPGHFDPIIERNTAVPVSKMKHYTPVSNNQSALELKIFQGEARTVRDNIFLGNLTILLPSGRREEGETDVRFTYDVNGLLQVEATLIKTGYVESIVIEGNPGLMTAQEIAQCLKELSVLKIHPRDKLEVRTLLARAERIYSQLRGDQRQWFGQNILAFEQALETQENHIVEAAREHFVLVVEQMERDSYLAFDPVNKE